MFNKLSSALQLSTKARISFGLVGLVLTVMMTAMLFGLFPDRHRAVMEGRVMLSESLAINTSALAVMDSDEALTTVLMANVERNQALLSAAIRSTDGTLIVEAGDHEMFWKLETGSRSTENQIRVPVRTGEAPWGTVELRFEPIVARSVLGPLGDPWLLLLGYIGLVCFVLFGVYLKRMLQHLDPSKAVPARVRTALDTLAEGLLIVDAKERIMLANQAFGDMLQIEPERLVGRSASMLAWEFPGDVDANDSTECNHVLPWAAAMVNKQSVANSILHLNLDDGDRRTFNVNCSPVLGQDGVYRGVLVSFDDITKLEARTVQLSEARQAADDANEAKSEFLARMSHEIRTPMNAILGYSDILRRGMAATEQERNQHLTTIHSSGEHLLALINDILDLSKIEAGKMELELARSSPLRLISEVVGVLKIKAEESGISLETLFPTQLPETILTDAVRVRQAIINLVGNAIKFTEHGGVKLVAQIVDGKDGRDMLAIDVVDSGIGMTPEAMEKVFQPFSQADTSITRRFGGTGLGLSISLQLAEKLGGSLTCKSQHGEGSVFTLTIDPGSLEGIPFIDPNTVSVAELSAITTPEPVEQRFELPPARILVVDDEAANRKLVRLYLARAGVEVVEAVNGKEAVEKAMESSFDVILMDMHMPVMDGFTAARTLRTRGIECDIIALTADVMKDDERKCRDAGCTGFLTKPISMERLVTTLAEVLGGAVETAQISTNATSSASTSAEDEAQQADLAIPVAIETQQTPATPDTTSDDRLPILSSLPTDDPEFRVIIEAFVDRLDDQVIAMRRAYERRAFAELVEFGHWIKGSAGTLGFDGFGEPGRALEASARAKDATAVERSLVVIEELNSRVAVTAVS